MNLLSIGNNMKLGRKVAVFNLPAGISCVGSTPLCRKLCYARKAERLYKDSQPFRVANLAASQSPGFVEQIVEEISAHNIKRMRWHESGDVYSKAYLSKIFDVCNQCPNTRFLLYTRSSHLDWSHTPKNLMVYWSQDKTSVRPIPKGGRIAYMVARGDAVPAGFITCKPGSQHNYCGDSCLRCWKGAPMVYFKQH